MHMFTATSLIRWDDGLARTENDELVAEEPLEIRVRGRAISVTMRTPDHDDELAAGFLVAEGVVRRREDIVKIGSCVGAKCDNANVVNVALNPEVPLDLDKLTRHVFAASSCGLCGKATINAIRHNSTRFPIRQLHRCRPPSSPPCPRRCVRRKRRSTAREACTPPPSSMTRAAWWWCGKTSAGTTPSTRSSATHS